MYDTYEKEENQNILKIQGKWFENFEKSLQEMIIDKYFHCDNLSESRLETINHKLVKNILNFNIISLNNKYFPIMPPHYSIKKIIEQVNEDIPESIAVDGLLFKTVSDQNFYEAEMNRPLLPTSIRKKIEKEVKTPILISMSSIYRDNPLMWPLMLHEYGHSIFENIKHEEEIIDIQREVKKSLEDVKIENITHFVETLVSECFADVFGVLYAQSNYFFAYCFHEFLGSLDRNLFGINKDNQYQFSKHPPPYIRMKYIMETYETVFEEEDPLYRSFQIMFNTYILKLSKNLQLIDSKYLKLFEYIYTRLISYAKKHKLYADKSRLNFEKSEKIYLEIKQRCPISTSIINKIKLKEKNKNIRIEEPNKINEIIYCGWKYLYQDMTMNYLSSNYNDYLLLLNKSKKIKKMLEEKEHEKIKRTKFNLEYPYLLSLLKYSIETSLIASQFMEAN